MSEKPVRSTKTAALLAVIDGLGQDKNGRAIGIRTNELAAKTGVAITSINVMLTPHIQSRRVMPWRNFGEKHGQ